jgi:site-specific DNA-methyltransferase (adenine-specific)
MNDLFNENVALKTETPAFTRHVLPAVPSSEVYLEDCVTALKRYADNHFDLAIVDPPYGIGISKIIQYNNNTIDKITTYNAKEWDNAIPTAEYWNELFRVSKNQIVWGGNYFTEYLKPTKDWILWDKMQDEKMHFAQAEMAWQSFGRGIRIFKRSIAKDKNNVSNNRIKAQQYKRIHPTQKPVALYEWILANYAKPNDLILDTHLGSGSSRIAAYKGGFNFVGFEIDAEYYEKQENRFNDFKSQLRLF